ncbi:hypothetical protein KCP74_22520 [Salmonella enterica subsp. enterica]|nr:hypothetical protein KCP74_22520 [Salmonella enterica subsp. enterica]
MYFIPARRCVALLLRDNCGVDAGVIVGILPPALCQCLPCGDMRCKWPSRFRTRCRIADALLLPHMLLRCG